MHKQRRKALHLGNHLFLINQLVMKRPTLELGPRMGGIDAFAALSHALTGA